MTTKTYLEKIVEKKYMTWKLGVKGESSVMIIVIIYFIIMYCLVPADSRCQRRNRTRYFLNKLYYNMQCIIGAPKRTPKS